MSMMVDRYIIIYLSLLSFCRSSCDFEVLCKAPLLWYHLWPLHWTVAKLGRVPYVFLIVVYWMTIFLWARPYLVTSS